MRPAVDAQRGRVLGAVHLVGEQRRRATSSAGDVIDRWQDAFARADRRAHPRLRREPAREELADGLRSALSGGVLFTTTKRMLQRVRISIFQPPGTSLTPLSARIQRDGSQSCSSEGGMRQAPLTQT